MNTELAQRLASGHAFAKHVEELAEYPEIADRGAFARLVEDVLTTPDATKPLSGDRTAYWHDGNRTVVILNPLDPDGGTVFRPARGRAYFDNL